MPVVEINGSRMHYEERGRGPQLLLLHGLGSCASDWEHQIGALATDFRVLCCDLRGHGLSDKPEGPYSIAGFAHDVAALLEALHVERTHVVGVSMGGMVALQLAADRPELVRRLVIVNSAAEVVPRGWQWALVWQRLAMLRLTGMARMARMVGKRLFPRPEQRWLRDTFEARFAANDKRAYTSALHAIVGWSVSERLPDIAAPALWISGDRDYTPPAVKERFVRAMPNAELRVIADSGHATPADQPEAFNRLVLEFLGQTTVRSRREHERLGGAELVAARS
jgi:3-oxoadipate enol-lactonase